MGVLLEPADLYRIARLRTLCPDIADVGLRHYPLSAGRTDAGAGSHKTEYYRRSLYQKPHLSFTQRHYADPGGVADGEIHHYGARRANRDPSLTPQVLRLFLSLEKVENKSDTIESTVSFQVNAMSSDKPSHRGSPYAQELISHLQPHCTTHKTDPGEQLDLQVNGQSMCYLILEGTIAIYRRSDDMMLTTARSPVIRREINIGGTVR